ncbi:hypothetical protein [Chitinophaga sp. YIM B06452]|uniref:hypothetical protein n=1 Tax=Chitinophaga sp. YIM B06452 TaxID=3082158 RepID=UPI0031FEFAD7
MYEKKRRGTAGSFIATGSILRGNGITAYDVRLLGGKPQRKGGGPGAEGQRQAKQVKKIAHALKLSFFFIMKKNSIIDYERP